MPLREAVPPVWYFNAGGWQLYPHDPIIPPNATVRVVRGRGRAEGTVVVPDFILGTTKPQLTELGHSTNNVGLTGTPLTDWGTGLVGQPDLVLGDGDHLSNLRIRANVVRDHPNSSLTNCLLEGRVAPVGSSNFRAHLLTDNTTVMTATPAIRRCRFRPVVGYPYRNAIGGNGKVWTERCDISRVTDGWHTGSSGDAQYWDDGSLVHDLAFWDNDPDHASDSRAPGWTHNDGAQLQCGGLHRFRGTWFNIYMATDIGTPDTLTNNTLSADMKFPRRDWGSGIAATVKAATTMEVWRCWFDGGERPLQVPNQPSPAGSTLLIGGCRFGVSHPYSSKTRYDIGSSTAPLTITANEPNVYGDAWAAEINISGSNYVVIDSGKSITTTPKPDPGALLAGTFAATGGTGTATALSWTTRAA